MKSLGLICLLITLCCCENRLHKATAEAESMQHQALQVSFDKVNAEIANVSETSKKPIQRMLIKNGTLTFETTDLMKARVTIQKLCAQYRAYLGSENQHNYDNRFQNDQEIRVPAENFDKLMQDLETLANKVENKSISAEDVTEQFIDIEARLKTKKEVETRYRQLLALAKNVNEMISIESQIGNVRSEIESMEGQLNYMKNQVSLSTIKLSYFEIIGTDFGFASKFVYSFRNGWDNLLTFLIGIVQVWPFLLVITLTAWLVFKWKKKRAMVA
jgi:hypothetical protein